MTSPRKIYMAWLNKPTDYASYIYLIEYCYVFICLDFALIFVDFDSLQSERNSVFEDAVQKVNTGTSNLRLFFSCQKQQPRMLTRVLLS